MKSRYHCEMDDCQISYEMNGKKKQLHGEMDENQVCGEMDENQVHGEMDEKLEGRREGGPEDQQNATKLLLQVALGELPRSQLQLHLGQKKSLPYMMMYLYHAHDML